MRSMRSCAVACLSISLLLTTENNINLFHSCLLWLRSVIGHQGPSLDIDADDVNTCSMVLQLRPALSDRALHRCRLLRTTTKYPAADLVAIAETLLQIVLHAELNVPVMVRMSKLLSKVRLSA